MQFGDWFGEIILCAHSSQIVASFVDHTNETLESILVAGTSFLENIYTIKKKNKKNTYTQINSRNTPFMNFKRAGFRGSCALPPLFDDLP